MDDTRDLSSVPKTRLLFSILGLKRMPVSTKLYMHFVLKFYIDFSSISILCPSFLSAAFTLSVPPIFRLIFRVSVRIVCSRRNLAIFLNIYLFIFFGRGL